MKLEEIIKYSDEEILAFMQQTPAKPFPEALHPEKFLYVSTSLLLKLFGENYRTHTFKFTDELGESIKKYGQIEPILLTKNGGKIIDTDGRGRFWSNFSKGADFMPVDIFYDIPELLKLEMEIDLNATKKKIDNEDIAMLAKNIYDGLVGEYSILSPDGRTKLVTPKAKGNALKLTAEVMCRKRPTIRKYLLVANLDQRILQDNKARRSAESFQRLAAIAKTFEEKDAQWKFYQHIRKQEEQLKKHKKELIARLYSKNKKKRKKKLKTLAAQEIVFSKNTFYGALLIAKDEKEQQSFMLTQKENKNNPIKKNFAYRTFNQTGHYLFGAIQLLHRFPELKEGLQKYEKENKKTKVILQESVKTLLSYIALSDLKSRQAVHRYFKENDNSFEERIKKRTKKEKKENPIIVRAVGEKPVFIDIKKTIVDNDQLRSNYDVNSIATLAEKIKKYGQVKPGIVYQIGIDEENSPVYKVIVGNRRNKACRLANMPYFKAFVCNNIKEYEIKIYQAIEDMFEQDTLLERSAMLHRMYQLAQKKAAIKNSTITLETFLEENRHLGQPNKLKRTMALLELPQVYQDMINTQLITPEGALAVNSLPEDYQMEFLFPLMTNPSYKRTLKKEVRKKQEELHLQENGFKQLKAFDDTRVITYNAFYEELLNKIRFLPQTYNKLEQTTHLFDKTKNNIAFNLSIARTVKEIRALQKEL